ncbi:alpha-D-ribose 1-methylphosphonate 5-triphosphate diphosphatase [Pseudoruegeria sp. SK021]|uniref:alpha-D-ribose 1-methylphosphonate 5-triphosphate diphosphatase n=1 Tax=Pseudoruegeria sp. SK021 TaxID=1933035 RepID=UPI000A23EA3B|nr:alpha-D-ribose 1-methylphosphonate 5-triphosphate diphosphatase [Pseudoruegeria sp. SK021]OSP55944.1 phosphonate metabolism protein PhnM [Pseudoruegeria sp. SK021]
MTQDTILTNARLILTDGDRAGTVCVRDGQIAEIDDGISRAAGALDCEGDFLCPGLIEVHTDNLERHLSPRPKVNWPHRAAILAHDRELAGTGITTVFDAIRVGFVVDEASSGVGKYARTVADEIAALRKVQALKISHHLHLRAEVCSTSLLEELAEFGPQDRVGIVSLMDHTPGQRQFTDLSKYEDYSRGKSGMSKDSFRRHVDRLHALRARVGTHHEAGVVAAAARYGATLASHDDTTEEQVHVSKAHGVTLAEFPTTVAAANTCHDLGIATIMGAPNLVRGGSHSGNVAARDLAALDRLDILSSDYVPASLLIGAIQLGQLWGNLAKGIATVTATPAQSVRLADRGKIAVGHRADLVQFRVVDDAVMIRAVWSGGRRVA